MFFENPFWVGVFEVIADGKLSAAKITFGAEPRDCEVYDFILKHYYNLQLSPAVTVDVDEKHINPKRMQREIKKQMTDIGVGTKSQQALKLQYEQFKTECKKKSREQKQEEKDRLFELKQLKKREKRKGH